MKIISIIKYSRLIAVAGLVLNLSACSDFLKEESQDEVIPTSAADYAELLIGSGYPDQNEPFNFLYLLDDDVEFMYDNPTVPGSTNALEDFPGFTWQPYFVNRNGLDEDIAETPDATAYADYYKWIMGCNAVLDNITEAVGTAAQKDRVRAEALAVRAFLYFRLVNVYGDPYYKNPEGLAVPLKLSSDIEEAYPARASVKEVYQQVLDDLLEASRLMEPLQIVRGDYHINQRAIHIILSRVYLYMEDWDNCIQEANKVFELGGRITPLPEIIKTEGQEDSPSTYLTYDNPEVEWVYGGRTQAVQNPYIPNRAFVASFSNTDARKSYFSETGQFSGYIYHLLTKLPSGTVLSQVIRSSEALLNRAEAYAQKQETALATKDLNQLRANRISDYSDVSFTSAEEALQAIRDERRKEFCYEGFRWFDLRRYGMPAIEHKYQAAPGEAVLTYTLQKEDPMYTLPLPNSLTSRNTNLEQNPSADEPNRIGE